MLLFVDRAKIHIKGGNGGNGCISFHRAKYVTNGGPDGGDGGRGGSVFFVADANQSTLMDFKYRRLYKAANGKDGTKNKCSGKNGESIYIKVPVGTLVREAQSNKVMVDLSKDGDIREIIRGGRGGRGNQHFATSTRQAPRYAENGKVAREYDVILELKLIADVGLVGYPNVGKSSILKMVTNANPKIANYHFTTLTPNLGVVRMNSYKDFILADIPGIIEGAHTGSGLGIDFLRHIERTKVLVHVVDAACIERSDPVDDIFKIMHELEQYNPTLLDRPQIIVANKIDIPDSKQNIASLKEIFEPKGYKVFPISAAANLGLDEMIIQIGAILDNYPEDIVFNEDFDEYIEEVIEEEPYTVDKISDNYYLVSGTGISKVIGRTNIDSEKGFAFFQKYLRDRGIIDSLENEGIAEGDTVRICDLEFEYFK